MNGHPHKRKRGRQPKETLSNVPNSSDASVELILLYKAEIYDLMLKTPVLASWIAQPKQAELNALLHALAHEVAFYPAMAGLIEATPQGRTGPKPKTAQALLMAQVRAALAGVCVHLPQWKNGRGQRNDLTDFCAQLIRISGQPSRAISSRTAQSVPERGWESLP